jgi:protein-disulfide isomerase
MKRDSESFLYKLTQGKEIKIELNENAFIFGDVNGILVTVFLSLHCSACAEIFDRLIKLVRHNKKIKVQFIFSCPSDGGSLQLLDEIYKLKDSNLNKALEELTMWYKADAKSRQNLLHNKIKIDNNNFDLEFEKNIEYNSSLFRIAEIVSVPSVYVDGYPLPSIYSIEDIKYYKSQFEKIRKQ